MSRRGLTKFDTSFVTNDGGKYSPSIRRLRQHYLHDTKVSSDKTCPSLTQQPTMLAQINDSSRLPSSHHRSSVDLISISLKCDDCQKHDGLFQCCHCNQRLCIRCCNKHYKKVTVELEYLHELNDCLLTKIHHTKIDLERQKNETIEQCHQWRIDTINTINQAHTLIIQTIHDEYEILGKEYELFVDKEMLHINLDKNELTRMKKGNLGSLLSSPSTTTTTAGLDPKKSIDIIKKRMETFAKYIDETGKFSFQVKLPKFLIDETLRVESRFGDITRSTSATWQHDEFSPNLLESKSNDISKQELFPSFHPMNSSLPECRTMLSPYSPSTKKVIQSHYDATDETVLPPADRSFDHQYEDCFSLSTDQLDSSSNNHGRTSSSSSSSPSIDQTNYDDEDTYQSIQHVQLNREQDGSLRGLSLQLEKSKRTDGIVDQQRTCLEAYGVRRKTTPLPPRTSPNTARSSNDNLWLYYRTNLSSSFMQ